jgi:hypothetical protein
MKPIRQNYEANSVLILKLLRVLQKLQRLLDKVLSILLKLI